MALTTAPHALGPSSGSFHTRVGRAAITSRSKLIRKLQVRGDLEKSGRCPLIPTGAAPVPFRSQRADKRRYDGATPRAKVTPEWIMRKCWRGGEYVHPHPSL